MTCRVLPEAEDEVYAAVSYLEQARPGHGTLLYAAYERAVRNATADPLMYPVADDSPPGHDVRYVYLSRFRYRLLYSVLPGELLIVAFAYAGREPGYWHDRLP